MQSWGYKMRLIELVSPEKHEFKKNKLYNLLSPYPKAQEAMTFAAKYHKGLRKDGVTPEFDHQISIVRFLLKIVPYCDNPDDVLTAGFLHDIAEDYNISLITFKDIFGPRIGRSVTLLTKVFGEKKRLTKNYFLHLSQDPIASIVKGADRVHNMSTLGGFTQKKKNEYNKETSDWIIPMLELARENFPSQKKAYDMLLRVLEWQSGQINSDL